MLGSYLRPALPKAHGSCQDVAVDARVRTPLDLERLVEHMFDQVLNESERAELLTWISAWEAAHPDADAAHRVTGWIDVAYAFQARGGASSRSRVRIPGLEWSAGPWVSAIA
jgi:uncharacterized protein YijF (DUF1287 family)